jgi:CheY-like chemotaxis protein
MPGEYMCTSCLFNTRLTLVPGKHLGNVTSIPKLTEICVEQWLPPVDLQWRSDFHVSPESSGTIVRNIDYAVLSAFPVTDVYTEILEVYIVIVEVAYLEGPQPSKLQKVLIDILSSQSGKGPMPMMLAQPARRLVEASEENQPGQSRPLRILLAEDNVSSQKVAQQMLKKMGYKVDTVANGIEALQALEQQHYDVVLMDLRMPEMDGLEATRIIRQRWPDGPKIIAITAYALEGDREKFIEAGMDDYISKPVQKEDLANMLEKYR